MIDKIRKILKDHGRLSKDALDPGGDADLYQAGMTSHASVNVMLALEGEFEIEFPDHMLKRSVFESIAAIRGAIAGAHPERRDARGSTASPAIGSRRFRLAGVRHARRRDRGPGGARARRRRVESARAPTTAAAALRAAGRRASTARRAGSTPRTGGFARVAVPRWPATRRDDELVLAFDGLATVADVWLDGAPLLHSDNMFLRARARLDRDRTGGELVIRCRALDRCSRRSARGRAGARR